MLMTKSLAIALLGTINRRFFLSAGAGTGQVGQIKLCIGDMPTDLEIESLTQTSARITNNVAVTLDTTGMTTMFVDSGWPAQISIQKPPTVPYALSTKVGTISWAVFAQPTNSAIAICDVTLYGGGGMIEVDTVDVVVGTKVTLMDISARTGRL